ncbi:Beta-phosphoglucomutase [Spironucleus salmonicida]|uniref:Beta-phosphoglucomutase n=1 Tax=Spironucleus salmonicida TaxID=348837 RepID=V6LAB0_9EUKA|nr:Beta-phosphoglucomutase [Spironucleus salmonicida]|eukprot:EST41327.1 Hydrolase, haloacid dehalogenase-like family [Spironucleus salmonicida]
MHEKLSDIKYYVFDFDGTLTDSINIWETIDLQVYSQFNIPYDLEKHFQVTMGFSMFDIASWIIQYNKLSNVKPEQIMDAYRTHSESIFATQIKFVPGAEKFLNYLIAQNIPFGIATASPIYVIDAFLNNYQSIKKHVQAVVSCDDVGKSKPDPAVYLECMKRIGAEPSQCAVFEDSLHGLQGAVNSGCLVVGILTDKRMYDQKKHLCMIEIQSYEELF